MTDGTKQSESQPGADWIRAALQVNPYSYEGVNAPSAKFADEASYNAALLDKCDELAIELIAVTDHWCVDSAEALIEEAAQRGIVALPGFEANSSEGVHLLVLFEAGTSRGTVNGAIGACGADPGSGNGTNGKPYAGILTEMSARGALVIPAHANVPNSGLLVALRGVALQNAIKQEHLHAVGIAPEKDPSKDQGKIFKRTKPYDRQHPLAKIYADDICSPAALEGVGGTTWFKVSEPCLESIKHAVRTPETRVSLQDPAGPPRVQFRSLTWTGGFLDDTTVRFAGDLTAFIGGRGTGKSTVIESLRYVMNSAPIGDDALRDHDAVVKKVLGSGTVIELEVEAVSPKPGVFKIQRTVPGPPQVFDSAGVVTQLHPEDVVGQIEIFGQHELAEVAQRHSTVAEMVKRFSGADDDSKMDEVHRELARNREQLVVVERDQANLDEELAELPRLQNQLDHFKDAKWPVQLEEQERLRADVAVFDEARRRIAVAVETLDSFAESDPASVLEQPYDLIDESPRKALLKKAVAATTATAKEMTRAIDAATKSTDNATAALDAAQAEWETKTASLRAQHAKVLRKLKDEGNDPDKYLNISDALKRLQSRAQDKPVLEKKHKKLLDKRKKLLGQLVEADTAARKHLASAVRKANKATDKAVIIKPIPAPERDVLTDIVTQHVKDVRKGLLAAVQEDNFSQTSFVAAARAGNADLVTTYGFTEKQAAAIADAGEPFLRQIEEVVIGQAVEVSLDVSSDRSGDYRALTDLSKGQRATALLLLLLGASDSPLVIDQPEDDLDNRFIFDGLVTELRRLKGARQVIVSTHNANVPVLGDAELIVTLEGDGRHGWPNKKATGSLDHEPVRKMAEHILEGGRLYGF